MHCSKISYRVIFFSRNIAEDNDASGCDRRYHLADIFRSSNIEKKHPLKSQILRCKKNTPPPPVCTWLLHMIVHGILHKSAAETWSERDGLTCSNHLYSSQSASLKLDGGTAAEDKEGRNHSQSSPHQQPLVGGFVTEEMRGVASPARSTGTEEEEEELRAMMMMCGLRRTCGFVVVRGGLYVERWLSVVGGTKGGQPVDLRSRRQQLGRLTSLLDVALVILTCWWRSAYDATSLCHDASSRSEARACVAPKKALWQTAVVYTASSPQSINESHC